MKDYGRYQNEYNGPLKEEFRDRIIAAKNSLKLTLAQTGEQVGLHASTMSQILNPKKPGRVGTKNLEGILRGLISMEDERDAKLGKRSVADPAAPSGVQSDGQNTLSKLDLASLVKTAHKHGFSVEFKPL